MPSQAQAMWDAFVKHLAETEPIGPRDKKTNRRTAIPHENFIGSAKGYEKIFLQANEPQEAA